MVMLQRRLHPHRRRLHPHRAERRGGRPTQGPTASSVPVHPCRCLVVSRPRAPEFPSGRQAAPGKSEGQRTCTRGSERRQGAAARLCGSHGLVVNLCTVVRSIVVCVRRGHTLEPCERGCEWPIAGEVPGRAGVAPPKLAPPSLALLVLPRSGGATGWGGDTCVVYEGGEGDGCKRRERSETKMYLPLGWEPPRPLWPVCS